jgi:hypothetical protein
LVKKWGFISDVCLDEPSKFSTQKILQKVLEGFSSFSGEFLRGIQMKIQKQGSSKEHLLASIFTDATSRRPSNGQKKLKNPLKSPQTFEYYSKFNAIKDENN